MGDSVRLYLRYAAVSIRAQMQYRASFAMMSVGNLFATGISFFGLWALFDRFGQIRGWTMPEVALFYGVVHIAFAIAEAFARGFDAFDRLVKSGDFDRILLRPRSTAFQIAASEIQLMRIGRFTQGAVVLTWALAALDLPWTAPRTLLLTGTVLGTAAMFAGIFVLQATLAFWTTESLEIVNTITYGGVETAQYPIAIYRPWFRRFFTFVVPLALVSYFPLVAVLGKDDPLGSPLWLRWVAPTAGFLFLAISLRFWRFGVRHYRSTGS